MVVSILPMKQNYNNAKYKLLNKRKNSTADGYSLNPKKMIPYKKTPSDSRTILTDLVLPGETNHLNAMFGGELLARMDRAASIASQRHSGRATVTVSVNHVAFTHSIRVGSIVTVEAAISRAFSSSMEVYIDVWMENTYGERTKATEAIYSFVAVGDPSQDEGHATIDDPGTKITWCV